MNELFPPETVAGDSPRLRWLKEHGVTVEKNKFEPNHSDDFRYGYSIVAHCCGNEGFGNTEDEAIVNLAIKCGWKLWNEP